MGKFGTIYATYRPEGYFGFVRRALLGEESAYHPTAQQTLDAEAKRLNEEQLRRGLYLYLITSFILKKGVRRHISYVGKSRDIMRRVKQHNGQLPKGPKPTRNASHPWKLAMVIGPYERHATSLRRLWRKKSRGIQSRLRYGTQTAQHTGKLVYADDTSFI